MEAPAIESLVLSKEEHDLLTQVLETEDGHLAIEIRHTANRAYREQLRLRLQMVDALLARLKN